MKFYMVKESADQYPRRDGGILIANELYTPKEFAHFGIPENYVTEINLPERKTYMFFGARFHEEELLAS